MQEITLFCKNCKRSLKIAYILTGCDDAVVLPNVSIKCHHCARVLRLKNYTEKHIKAKAQNGTCHI